MERVRLCVCVPGGGGQGRLTATRDYVAALGDLLGYRPGPDGAVRDVARDVTGGVTRVYVASDDPEAVAEARALVRGGEGGWREDGGGGGDRRTYSRVEPGG